MAAKKIKILGLKKLDRKLQKKIDSIATNKGLMQGMAKFALKETKYYVRVGFSPKTDKKFPPLKDSTIRTRDSFQRSKKGRKSPYFIPDFSNLTMTGQLVRSMKIKYDKKQQALVMSFSQKRKNSSLSNDKLIEHLDEMGRYIVGIPKKVKPKLVTAINIFLKRRRK